MSIADQHFGPDVPQSARMRALRMFCGSVGVLATLTAVSGLRHQLFGTGRVHTIVASRFIWGIVVASVVSALPLLAAAIGLGFRRRWAVLVAILGIRVAFLATGYLLVVFLVEFSITVQLAAPAIGIDILATLAFLSWAALLALMHSVATDTLKGNTT